MAKSRPSKSSAKPKKKAVPAKTSKASPKAKSAKPTVHAAKAVVRATKLAVKAVKLAVKAVKADVVKAIKVETSKPVKSGPAKAGKSDAVKAGKSVNGRKLNHEPIPAKSVAKEAAFNAPSQKRTEPIPESELTPFLRKQRERLVQLRDNMLDSMTGVAKDTLRSRAEGSEASAFGMHQADAGSDAYDRDFALSLLSQEQDALYEIEEALKRIDLGTYGTCEMSGKPIARVRLEAIPFARYTVECQSQLEKQNKVSRSRVPVTSLFGLTDGEEGAEGEEEEPAAENKE
jgi:DnaK suppressor protein